MTRAELLDFMRQHRYAVLSSVSARGEPESAVVGIAVSREFEIVFDTVKTSRKYQNLLASPAVAVVLWTGEKTVQYEGLASEVDDRDGGGYREVYFERFPDGRDRLSWSGITHFVIVPKWIRYSDFDSSPPVIEEFSF